MIENQGIGNSHTWINRFFGLLPNEFPRTVFRMTLTNKLTSGKFFIFLEHSANNLGVFGCNVRFAIYRFAACSGCLRIP